MQCARWYSNGGLSAWARPANPDEATQRWLRLNCLQQQEQAGTPQSAATLPSCMRAVLLSPYYPPPPAHIIPPPTHSPPSPPPPLFPCPASLVRAAAVSSPTVAPPLLPPRRPGVCRGARSSQPSIPPKHHTEHRQRQERCSHLPTHPPPRHHCSSPADTLAPSSALHRRQRSLSPPSSMWF